MYVKKTLMLCVYLVLPGVIFGCSQDGGADVAPASAALGGGDLLRFLRGRDVFFNEEFGGNGRRCVTCHRRDSLDDNFDFTSEDAQALFAEDPADPLFRPIDSDDGAGEDYSTLLNHGLVNVELRLPPNVFVLETDSPRYRVDAEGNRYVRVWRSTPSIENIAVASSIMWDGREGTNLEHQAGEAVLAHFNPTETMTEQEARDVAFFQRQFFTQLATRVWANGGPPPSLPDVPAWRTGSYWNSVRRGRREFVDMPVTLEAPGGRCATCHSGPNLDHTNAFNPVQVAGENFTNNFVSEVNAAPFVPGGPMGNGLPELTYVAISPNPVIMPDLGLPPPFPPAGTVVLPPGLPFTLRSSDPGRLLITGDPCEAPLACLINSDPSTGRLGTVSNFRISSLWGTADSAPYFHDNSAEDLEELLEHYQVNLFGVTAAALGPQWALTDQQAEDVINYMEFAFRRHPLL